jgi:hypothetical protein
MEVKMLLASSQLASTFTEEVCEKYGLRHVDIPNSTEQVEWLYDDLVRKYMDLKIDEEDGLRGNVMKETLKREVLKQQFVVSSSGMDIRMQMELFYVRMLNLIKDIGVTLTEKERVLLMIDAFQDKLLMLKVLMYIHRDRYVIVDLELKLILAGMDTMEGRLEKKRSFLLNNCKKWCIEVGNVLSIFGQLVNDFYGSSLPVFQYAKEFDNSHQIAMTIEEEVTLGVEYSIAIKERDESERIMKRWSFKVRDMVVLILYIITFML